MPTFDKVNFAMSKYIFIYFCITAIALTDANDPGVTGNMCPGTNFFGNVSLGGGGIFLRKFFPLCRNLSLLSRVQVGLPK